MLQGVSVGYLWRVNVGIFYGEDAGGDGAGQAVHLVSECSIKQLAEKLNISLAAAKARLYRARMHLGVIGDGLPGSIENKWVIF
jgi:hypothetical protein